MIFASRVLSSFLFILVVDILSRMVSLGVEKGVVECFKVGKEYVSLPHLQFVDDTFFWGVGNFLSKSQTVFFFKSFFKAISGLKINNRKGVFYSCS